MGLGEHESSNKVPYSVDDAYGALKGCIDSINEFSIDRYDDLLKTVYLKAGVSLFSWGELITVNIRETIDGIAEIIITSTPKTGMFGGAMDMGKNRKNINTIMHYLSEELKKYQEKTPNSNSSDSIADKIKQLSKLKEEGLITEKEYSIKKSELLSKL